ncbi:UNVERIFIED_CONTAM: Protein BCCIP [Sesamum indicum]
MPRKPTRHNPSSRHRPLTFSAFGRSMAMAILSKKARREIHEPKDLPTSSGNGCVNHGKDKMEESNSSDSEDFEGVVQADFVFFDPKPGDFHGVKVLLQTYLDNKLWDLSSFVDLILGQPTVGTVVKIENDEDDGVYSVVTALNLERYKASYCLFPFSPSYLIPRDSKCVIELKDYLLKVCEDMDVIPKLRNLVGEHAKDVGLVVSQRVVNLPPQLLPPLYDALFDEIEWATEDEHKNANGKKGMAESGEEAVIYMKPEDEIFLELSSWSFSFPLHAQQVTTNEASILNFTV